MIFDRFLRYSSKYTYLLKQTSIWRQKYTGFQKYNGFQNILGDILLKLFEEKI